MKLFLCSHFSSVGSLIKEEIENKKVAFIPTASLREAGAYRQRPLHPAGQPCPDPTDVRHPHELGHEVCGRGVSAHPAAGDFFACGDYGIRRAATRN